MNMKSESKSHLRQESRLELARRGFVVTETEIAKWKDERASRSLQEQQLQGQQEYEHLLELCTCAYKWQSNNNGIVYKL